MDSKPMQEKSKQVTLTSSQFFNALNKYIPSLVLQNWVEDHSVKMQLYDLIKKQQLLKKQLTKKSSNSSQFDDIIGGLQARVKEGSALPHIQDMETVVLFADISGFTKISEACAAMGIRGNEELAFCINRYMEGMVKNLSKFGGDIIKFVGDAMIVMWPTTPRKFRLTDEGKKEFLDDDDGSDKVTIIRKAIQCAYDIQKEFNNKRIMANVTNLSVKIGIGFGKCALLYVGGIFNRSEFFTVGPALLYALGSEEQATGGGQIIVSESAFRHLNNQYYQGAEIIAEDGKKFYRITGVKKGVRGRADAILLKSQIKVDRQPEVQKQLKSCVPAAIIPYLEIGFEQFGSETRALTVMFASLGVDLSSASTEKGLQKIQKIVTTVQQQVYRLEGSLNKLVMDDKGSTLICIWGLSPYAHPDDAQRAILTALNMRRELLKIDNTWCNVGLATGDVFSGVVGTSGSRKEFSVLGDVVNLAARIMFWPLKFKQTGKINCCMRTKNEAMSQISFNYGSHCEFKGKSISIPIFEPIDPEIEFDSMQNKLVPPQCYLKLCSNPLIVQKSVNHKKFHEKLVVGKSFVNEIYDTIRGFFYSKNIDPESPLLNILIQGEPGSGKTYAARALVEKLLHDQDMVNQNMIGKKALSQIDSQSSKKQQASIFASAVNCESRMKYFGSWRPILRNVFLYMQKSLGVSKTELLRRVIKEHYDKIEIFLDLFGLTTSSMDLETKEATILKYTDGVLNGRKQMKPCHMVSQDSPISFLLRDKYESYVTEDVIELLVMFISQFIGEDSLPSDSGKQDSVYDVQSLNISDLSNKKYEFSKIKDRIGQLNTSNVYSKGFNISSDRQKTIFLFDNASQMDEESYSLVLRLFNSCQNLCVIMIVGQDQSGNAEMPFLDKQPSVKSIVDNTELAKAFMTSARVFELQQLHSNDLTEILLDLAPKYKSSYEQEVKSMTDIIDPAKTIKNPEQCQEWIVRLTEKYQLQDFYKDIDPQISDLVVKKCQGNPLICLQFFFNLIECGYIKNENQTLVPNENLLRCIRLQNFVRIKVPPSIHKRRLRNLDMFLKKGRLSGNPRKQELCIKGIMTMKAATIIGEEFDSYSLRKILPLRNENQGTLLQILKELELNDFIEILNESDPKNVRCRFNKYFLRESIYQVMLFRDQKQVLHQQYAEHLQSLPTSVMEQTQIDIEIEKLKENLMIGADIEQEEDLPFKVMQGIFVKQMQSLLIKNNNKEVLYQGKILKQGQKANKKVSVRHLVLFPKEVAWFRDKNAFKNRHQALGIIRVEHIFNISQTRIRENTYDFDISVTQYIKKGQREEVIRTIKFGCETENMRNHWISRLEFLRTKCTYDNYVNKFASIQFPLRKADDEEEDQELQNEMLNERLMQFGKNVKQSAQINHLVIGRMNRIGSNFRQQFKTGKTVKLPPQGFSVKDHTSPDRRVSTISAILPRVSSFSNNDEQSDKGTANPVQEMAKNLKQLYTTGMVAFTHQININANKSSNQGLKNKPLGKLPEYLHAQLEQRDASAGDKSNRSGGSFDFNMREAQQAAIRKQSRTNSVQENTAPALIQKEKQDSKHGRKNGSRHSILTPTPANIHQIQEQSEKSSSSQSQNKRNYRKPSETPNPKSPNKNSRDIILNEVDSESREGSPNIANRKNPRLSQRIASGNQKDGLDQDPLAIQEQAHELKTSSGNSVSKQLEQLEKKVGKASLKKKQSSKHIRQQSNGSQKVAPGFSAGQRGFTFNHRDSSKQKSSFASKDSRELVNEQAQDREDLNLAYVDSSTVPMPLSATKKKEFLKSSLRSSSQSIKNTSGMNSENEYIDKEIQNLAVQKIRAASLKQKEKKDEEEYKFNPNQVQIIQNQDYLQIPDKDRVISGPYNSAKPGLDSRIYQGEYSFKSRDQMPQTSVNSIEQPSVDVENLIQIEITKQVNQGLKNFFSKFENQIDQEIQRKQSSLSPDNVTINYNLQRPGNQFETRHQSYTPSQFVVNQQPPNQRGLSFKGQERPMRTPQGEFDIPLQKAATMKQMPNFLQSGFQSNPQIRSMNSSARINKIQKMQYRPGGVSVDFDNDARIRYQTNMFENQSALHRDATHNSLAGINPDTMSLNTGQVGGIHMGVTSKHFQVQQAQSIKSKSALGSQDDDEPLDPDMDIDDVIDLMK